MQLTEFCSDLRFYSSVYSSFSVVSFHINGAVQKENRIPSLSSHISTT